MIGVESNNSSAIKSSEDFLPAWPSEEAPAQMIEEYFRMAEPLVTLKGYDYDVRGETPPQLLKYDKLIDTTGITELTPASDATPTVKMQIQKHNLMLRGQIASNDLLTEQGAIEKRRLRNLFAQAIILSLTPNAPLRLDNLKKKHAVTGHADTYDGTANVERA